MGDLGVDKEYGDVSVSMGAGKVNGADFLIVEEHRRRLLKRNLWQGNRRLGLNVPLAKFTACRQAFADIDVGQNRRVLAKGAVATDVIAPAQKKRVILPKACIRMCRPLPMTPQLLASMAPSTTYDSWLTVE